MCAGGVPYPAAMPLPALSLVPGPPPEGPKDSLHLLRRHQVLPEQAACLVFPDEHPLCLLTLAPSLPMPILCIFWDLCRGIMTLSQAFGLSHALTTLS